MPIPLKTDDDLRAACQTAISRFAPEAGYQSWVQKLGAYLAEIQNTPHEQFITPAFQEKLWNTDTISSTGNGSVDVSKIISSKDIAEILWQVRTLALPPSSTERSQALLKSWKLCSDRINQLNDRMPWLKMSRVFAALQPECFTTIAYMVPLRNLAREMAIPDAKNLSLVELHQRILDRMTAALGTASEDKIHRMTLPWLLHVLNSEHPDEQVTSIPQPTQGAELLQPVPAAGRRRGMLAIAGYFSSIIGMLQFAKEGCSRADLRAHIRSLNSNLSAGSVDTNINALIAEWGALKADGDQFQLTSRGEALLASSDPAEVQDWLLTRILGFDNVLKSLETQPLSVNQTVSILQDVNPGWTSDFAPKVLIKWLRELELAEVGSDKLLHLTGDGRSWATQIFWTPGKLPRNKVEEKSESLKTQGTGELQRPTSSEIAEVISGMAAFPASLIAQLHASLWLNPRRHFAVLTGLSGAGKTLLARAYGKALWRHQPSPEEGLCTIPVQPSWHDPSCLLGYKNPLAEESDFVRTEFLKFLLLASGNPNKPYTVVLDEMNLSHPEQYLAPLLSAMETGDDIVLHSEVDEICGVPPSIPYPENLVIIGTVNMDETTHGLSDKVLDRASVIDFWDIDVEAYPHWNTEGLNAEHVTMLRDVLIALGKALRPARLHFGWRTISDILGYVQVALSEGGLSIDKAADHAIYSKVLPKLRGEDSPRLRAAFAAASDVLDKAGLVTSREKLRELTEDLKTMGSARFWR